MIVFLRGALAMCCLVSALFFLRFWRESRERLMAVFSGAFVLLGASWTLLAINVFGDEANAHVFAIRALAFGLIALGIFDKNRRG
ncbi:MAG: DUF5985 family protein [Myxococcota bacterium]